MASTKLERGSYWATIVAAAVATLAFGFGYFQFSATQEAQRETLELERESQAVELFSKYNELMREAQPNPGPASSLSPSPAPSPNNNDPEFWKNNLAISIAESIFRLRHEDEGWVETVGWMLRHHTEHLKGRGLNCKTFNEDFIKFVNQEIGQDVCRP